MNGENSEIQIIRQKVLQFYSNGSNHHELVDLINNKDSLRLCFEFYNDSDQYLKHFGITGLINKIKKQLINDNDLLWLNVEINKQFYGDMPNSAYFVKMVAYLKLNIIPNLEIKSFLDIIKQLPNDNERQISRNQHLICSMFEILTARDAPQSVLNCLSQILHQECIEILRYTIDIGNRLTCTNLQLSTIKSLSFLYNYSPEIARSIPELQQYVMKAVVSPELFSEAVELLTNILITSNLNSSTVDLIIRHTLMQNPIVEIVIRDQKEAVRNQIEWRDRDNFEKQKVYALCEYLGSLINLAFENMVALFTNVNEITVSEKESVEYLLNLLLQLLNIEGDVPKYNDIFVGIVNNVHILLEELFEVYDGTTPTILAFQRNLIDIFFTKLKHPFSYGCTDVDIEEFLDNRDNMSYAFESMSRDLLNEWLKEKLSHFIQNETINISDVETVLYFYSQLPDFTEKLIDFNQLHIIFQRSFVNAGEFQETLIDTYIVLLKEIFIVMSPEDLDQLISFIWDILRNYQPALVTASNLLCSIYLQDDLPITSISNPRETQTLMLIKQLTQDQITNYSVNNKQQSSSDSSSSWREYGVTLYAIVGRLSAICTNNDELTSLSSVFINPLFTQISKSIQHKLEHPPPELPPPTQIDSTAEQNNSSTTTTDNHNLLPQIDNPHELIIANQISLLASFLAPHSRFPNSSCDQFLTEMVNALLSQLEQIADTIIYSIEFYLSMLRLIHCIVSLSCVINTTATIQRLANLVIRYSTTVYRAHNQRSRASCLELVIASIHCLFQHCIVVPQNLSARCFIFFTHLLLDYTFNRCPPTPNYYMPTFISRCLKLLHSVLVEHGPPSYNGSSNANNGGGNCSNSSSTSNTTSATSTRNYYNYSGVSCSCYEHTPTIQRANLHDNKLNWLQQSSQLLAQVKWDNILFIPAFYLGDLTPEVNRASIRLLISIVRCRHQLPEFISSAFFANIHLIVFNIVKLFAFGMTEIGDLVSFLMAFRECAPSESVNMVEVVNREPLIRSNVYLQTVTRLVHHLLTIPKLTSSLMRSHIVNFQETLRLIPPPPQINTNATHINNTNTNTSSTQNPPPVESYFALGNSNNNMMQQ